LIIKMKSPDLSVPYVQIRVDHVDDETVLYVPQTMYYFFPIGNLQNQIDLR